MKKTNALRILDQRKISYQTFEYKYDPDKLSSGQIVKQNGLQEGQVFKTLVAKGDKNGVVVAVVSGVRVLDLKALAKISGNKKINLIPVKELLSTVGYIRGGCSPLGMKKVFPVFIDRRAEEFKEILVNAGVRGLLMKLKVEDLLLATNGKIEDIAIERI